MPKKMRLIVLNSFGIVHFLCHLLTSASTLYNTDICTCPCSAASYNLSLDAAITTEEAREKASELERELAVDKKTTSVAGRKRLSQPDPRASAKSIGVVGTAFLVLVFVVLCLSDVVTCMKNGQVMPKKKLKLKKSISRSESGIGNIETEDSSSRSVVDVSQSEPVTHVSHTSTVHFSVARILHSMNKSMFHFPVFVRDQDANDNDVMMSSFPMNYLSEPLLPSPTRSAVLFRRSSSRRAGSVPLQDCLQQEDVMDDNSDTFGVNGLHAPYKYLNFGQNP